MMRIIKAILALTGLDDTFDADLHERYPVVNRLFDDMAEAMEGRVSKRPVVRVIATRFAQPWQICITI